MPRIDPIDISDLERVALGARRPEDIAVSREGDVWISDRGGACARIKPDGRLHRIGQAGGLPNGICFDHHGQLVIANLGGFIGEPGPLQRLDPDRGRVDVVCAEVAGRALQSCNYPLVDSAGRIWCSHSTWGHPADALFGGLDDGFIFVVGPDGEARVAADGLRFPNGLAMDADETHLYVCQTAGCDVLRFPIESDGQLGRPGRYGPTLGLEPEPGFRELPPKDRSAIGCTDGCAFDVDGNLWVTLFVANKVVVITPSGDVATVLSDPDATVLQNPTNVTFDGHDLYIGSDTASYVVKARTAARGMPLATQRRP